MKVRIEDKDALQALAWEELKAYLDRAKGWKYAEDIGDKAIVYQHKDKSGRLREILVPIRRDLGDYARRMADAVSTLARVEKRSELDVYEDLSQSGEAAAHKVHARIRQWLAEEGWNVGDFPDSNSWFNLKVDLPSGQTMNILQPKAKADSVVIAAHLLLQDDVGPSFAKLPPQRQKDVLWDLLRDLSLIGVEFRGAGIPLRLIEYFVPVFFDGLTKDILVHRMHLISRALVLSAGTFLRALEELDGDDRPSEATIRLRRLAGSPAEGLLRAAG